MELGVAVVSLVRLLIPLTILRFPLLGGILSVVVDYFDMDLLKLFGSNLLNYQTLDKGLDIYYLSLEAYVSAAWKNILAKRTSLILFTFRLTGFFLFLIFQNHLILLVFPNLFEFFYLFYLSFKKIHKFDPVTSVRRLVFVLFMLLLFKIIHEYFLHINTTYPWTDNKYVKLLFK